MNKHINRMLELLLIVLTVYLAGLSVWQNFQIKKRDYALREFAVVNDIPIEWTQKEIKNIKKYAAMETVPEALIMAIGMSEKGLGSHTFGCKRIDLKIQLTMPIDDWQLCMCIEIVRQEMFRYCDMNGLFFKNDSEMLDYINGHKKHFMYQLAMRYCPNNAETWYSNVITNWVKFEKAEDVK